MVRTCVLQGYGINADEELIFAFREAGSEAFGTHVADLIDRPAQLGDYRVLAFPGGFSFGDHLGSGRVLASLLDARIRRELAAFISDGGLIIGICNGFQVLVKMGLLPGQWTGNAEGRKSRQTVSLIHNTRGRFIDAWVELERDRRNHSPWLGDLARAHMPIRHGEGRFVCEQATLDRLRSAGRIALRYRGSNPNGSLDAVAGITDATGRVFGLMPHPEAYLTEENHPAWHRGEAAEPTGIAVFRNAVAFAEAGQ